MRTPESPNAAAHEAFLAARPEQLAALGFSEEEKRELARAASSEAALAAVLEVGPYLKKQRLENWHLIEMATGTPEHIRLLGKHQLLPGGYKHGYVERLLDLGFSKEEVTYYAREGDAACLEAVASSHSWLGRLGLSTLTLNTMISEGLPESIEYLDRHGDALLKSLGLASSFGHGITYHAPAEEPRRTQERQRGREFSLVEEICLGVARRGKIEPLKVMSHALAFEEGQERINYERKRVEQHDGGWKAKEFAKKRGHQL